MKTVIFDLDGTLSDSSEGIFRSLNYALGKMNAPGIERSAVGRYIGPPLSASFSELLQTRERAVLDQAVEHFRDDYAVEGYKINALYDGIAEVIARLASEGYRLFIATTKKEDIACDVLRHFGLEGYFQGIYGGGSEIPKPELLRQLFTEHGVSPKQSVMVGDTHYDIAAARENQTFAIGVAWGFGAAAELVGADVVAATPVDLPDSIDRLLA